MKQSEIRDIIERRKVLVETATSEAQKEIYQGYLDTWNKKLNKKDRIEEIEKREAIKVAAAEKAQAAKLKREKAALEKNRIIEEQKRERAEKLKRKVALQKELAELDEKDDKLSI